MKSLTRKIEDQFMKQKVAEVKSGDTIKVYQKIKEGNKERVQVFEGLVINTKRGKSLTSSITVRRLSSGIGVEKTFLLHSPLIEKVEVVKRSKVNRKYLTYMRDRSGKSARLDSVEFDRDAANDQNSQTSDSKDDASDADDSSNQDVEEVQVKETDSDDDKVEAKKTEEKTSSEE